MDSAIFNQGSFITDDQRRQYQEEGYFILERVIPEKHLSNLQQECQRFLDETDAEMDRQGVTTLGINHKGNRYFVPFTAEKSTLIREFVFSPLMAEVCRSTIGQNAYWFLDQYVVKAAEQGMKFGWHQDEGYIAYPNPPYVTCWCALDDVNEENGTIYVLPYSRAGSKVKVPHVKEEGTNDMVGYFGDDPGIPVNVPAGSIAVFSSTCFHRSGQNKTNKMRRSFLVQYSGEPIYKPSGEVHLRAEPFIEKGRIIASD